MASLELNICFRWVAKILLAAFGFQKRIMELKLNF